MGQICLFGIIVFPPGRKEYGLCVHLLPLESDLLPFWLQRLTYRVLQPLNTLLLTYMHIDIHKNTHMHAYTPPWPLSVSGRKHRFCPTGSLTDIWMDGSGSWLDVCVHHALIFPHVTSMNRWRADWFCLGASSQAVLSPPLLLTDSWTRAPPLFSQCIPYFFSHMLLGLFIYYTLLLTILDWLLVINFILC